VSQIQTEAMVEGRSASMSRFRTAFGFASTLVLLAAPTAIKARANAADDWVGEGVA
jgi:hypothetical protein